MNSFTLLSILTIACVLYAGRLLTVETRVAKRDNFRLQRELDHLRLNYEIALDDLDSAIEVIASEGAKRRHPATSWPQLKMINGGRA